MFQSRISRWTIASGLLFTLLISSWATSRAQGGDIPYGQTVSGTVKADDKDIWHFVGSAGDLIAISAQRTDGNLEPAITLQDPSEQTVAGTQATSDQRSVTLQVRLAQSGSYLINLAASNKTAGAYSLSVALMSSSAPVSTPQATTVSAATAGNIVPGSSSQGELTDHIFRQLWRFHGNFGDILDIRMVRQTGDLIPILALVSPLGDVIAASDSTTSAADAGILAFELPFTGDYTIIARREGNELGADGKTAGQYQLTLALRGPGTAAQNTLLTPGSTIKGRLSDNSPVALYRMETGGAVAVSLDLGSLHRVARIRILTTTGGLLLDQQGLSPFIISAHIPDQGPFLVEVSSANFDNQTFSDFGLTIYRLSASIAISTGEAMVLHYGDHRQSTVTGADNWIFVGHTGESISLNVTPEHYLKDTSLRISGPQDILLYQGELGPGVNQTLTLADNGVYDVEIRPGDSTAALAYTLDLNRLGANGNAFDQFSTAAAKGPLTANAAATGSLAAGAADGWWLDANAGQVINLTAGTVTGNSILGLTLKRPDGSVLETQVTEGTGGAVIRQARLEQTGRYQIVVFDDDKNSDQYTLSYEDAFGGILQSGQTAKGLAIPTNTFATWSLNVVEGALINTRLTTLSTQNWSPVLYVAAPDGRIIASNTDQPLAGASAGSATGAMVDLLGVQAPATGTYQVVVGGQLIGTFASYDLVANVQAPFSNSADIGVQVSAIGPAVPRFVAAPTVAPVQVPIAALISPPNNTDKQKLDSAPPLSYGATVRGEIPHAEFSAAWQFGGIQSVTIGLTATSLSGSIGPDLTLYDGSGNIVHQQLHTEDATTVMTYRMPQGGPYKVLVRMGLDGGRYLLSLSNLPVGILPTTVLPGTPLVYGQTISGEMVNNNQADRFYFEGTANDVVSIAFRRATGDLAPALHLYGPNNVEVTNDINSNNNTTATIDSFKLPIDGMYSLVADQATGAAQSTGRYFLTLGIDSGFRLGNRGGGVIVSGGAVTGLLNETDSDDTWLFNGHVGQSVSFTLTGQSDPLPVPLGIRLLDTVGDVFAAQDATLTQGALRLSNIILPAEGVYRVQVVGGTDTPGTYQLRWQPEDASLALGALHYNESVGGVFTSDHKADSWVFSGTAGDVISIALNYERGDKFSGGIQLRSENGLTLATVADLGNGAGARVDNLLLPFSGSYTLVAANPDPAFHGSGIYALNVNLQDSKARSMGTVLTAGQKGQGDIYVDDPVDTWIFSAQGGDEVSVTARASDQFLKPSVELHTPIGTLLAAAESDKTTRNGLAKIENFKIEVSGIFVISISGGPDKTTGNYLVSLDTHAQPLNEAPGINYGDTKEGLIANDRPQQVYTFSARKGDSITALVAREAKSTLAMLLSIQDQDGNTLAQSDANDADSTSINAFKLPSTGSYALVVGRYLTERGQTTGRFKVSLNGTPEDRPIKGSVPYGQAAIGNLGFNTPEDRITFTGQAGDVVGIVSRATSGDLDTNLSIEDSTGKVLATNDDSKGTNAVIAGLLLPSNDTYTIVISRLGTSSISSSGNYELTVNRLYQVNASAAPQSLISYGQRIIGTIDAQSAENRYTFSGNQGDEVTVNLVHQMDDAPPQLTVQDPANTVLAQGTLGNGQTEITSYRLPADGLYTISIKRPLDAKQVYNPFALTLSLVSSAPAQARTGGVLAVGNTVTGNFTSGAAAQYWLFEGQAGQTISANIVHLTGNLLPSVLLISPTGQSLASFGVSGSDSSASLNQFELPVDGVYNLLVLPDGVNQAGQYRLTLQPNVSVTPPPVQLTSGQIVSGTLSPTQVQQVWSFVGQTGESISARMLIAAGNMIPDLQVLASDGHVLATGHLERLGNQLSSVLTATLPATGAFKLVAGQSDESPASAGEYRLSFETGALSPQAIAARTLAYNQSINDTIQQGTTSLWAFNGTAGDTVNAEVTVANGMQSPGLILEDSSGRVLSQVAASDSTEASIVGFTLPSDGLYVLALPAQATVSYTLVVQRRQDLLPADASSRPLTADQALDGEIGNSTLTGYWSFQAEAGSIAQITGARLNGDLRVDFALYGPSGYITSATADESGKLQLGPVRLGDGGKYTLVVSRWMGAAGKTSGRYTVTMSLPQGVSGSTGGFLPVYGQTVTGGIIDGTDTWSFDGQGGDVIDVQATRTDGNLVPTLKLVEAQAAQQIAVSQGDQGDALISGKVLPSTGRYSVIVGRGGNTSGGYKLVVRRVQTALQANMTHAEGIQFGDTRTGELTKDAPAHAYVFFGTAGERITADATQRSSTLNPSLLLFGPDGNTLAADDQGSSTQVRIVSFQLPTNGFYGLVITASTTTKSDQPYGGYSLTLQHDQPGATFQGSLDVGQRVVGTLIADQPIQEWTFETVSGKTIAASLQSTSAMFDASVSIISEDGHLLSAALVKSGVASTETTLPGPGRYAILVSANVPAAQGNYQLSVSYALAPSGGGALVSGEQVTGAIDDSDFTDSWHFDLKADSKVAFALGTLDTSDLALDVTLYTSDGTQVALDQSSRTLNLSAGSYLLMVSRKDGAAGQSSGSYSLQMTVS